MGLAAHKKLSLCLLFLFLPLCLYAQTKTVALIPFWGDYDAPIVPFGYALNNSVGRMYEYSPWPVDMSPASLPADVPPGGYPPYIAPSPSLTRGAPFALTGEVTIDTDTYDIWHLRLYLWQMSAPPDGNPRLIASDELTAYDEEACELVLPGLLEWLFSLIPSDEGPVILTGGQSKVVYYAATEPYKWLYVGLKAGWPIRVNANSSGEPLPPALGAFSIAAHANVQIFNYFGVQLEGMLTMGLSEPFKGASLMVPALLRYSYYSGTMVVSGLGGIYLNLPTGDLKENFIYERKPMWGITAGFNLGNKIGPGFLYLDLRWGLDLGRTIYNEESVFRRNVISVCAGYEMGFLTKKKK